MQHRLRFGWLFLLVSAMACPSNCGGADTNPGTDPGPSDTGNVDPGGQDPSPDGVAEIPADVFVDVPGDPGQPPKDSLEGVSDPGAADDGGPPPPGPHPLFEFTGKIGISEKSKPEGGAEHSGVGALIWDAPPDTTHTLVNETGDCQYWLVILGQDCDPECDFDEYCGTDGKCHPDRDRVGAGTITVSGTAVEVQLVPDDSDWYLDPGEAPADLFGPGDTITVEATGDEIPAFKETVSGVGDMLAPWATGSLTMVDGADLILPWVVQGDGATVEVALQTGWHGVPPVAIIWCSAPDDAGVITVPQMFVEAYPAAGGMGLFPHVSWVQRISRKVVDGPFGPLEVKVYSRRTFSLIHNPW